MDANAPLASEAPHRQARRNRKGPSALPEPRSAPLSPCRTPVEVPLIFGTILPLLPELHHQPTTPQNPQGGSGGPKPTPTTRCAEAQDFIMSAISMGCSLVMIEQALSLPCGCVSSYLLSSRQTMLLYAISLCEAADQLDMIAQGYLQNGGAKGVRPLDKRLSINVANTIRCRAEGRRRLGESLVRRASEIPKERERAQRAANRKQRPGTMTLPEMAGIASGRRAERVAPESGEAS